MLAAAAEAQCNQWLLDLRRREDAVGPVVNAWFGTTFAPSLWGRCAAPVRLAFLVSPLRVQQPITAAVSAENTNCRIATFTDEAAAHA